MVSFEIMFELALSGLATLVAMGSSKLYSNIKKDEQKVMTKFKLKSGDTYRDFQMFLAGEVLLLVTFLTYPIALLNQNNVLLTTARVTLIAFLALIVVGVLRMWRRSR